MRHNLTSEHLPIHDLYAFSIQDNLPDVSGIDLCLKIRNEFPEIYIIALSTFNQRSYIAQMMQNGASGYLLKSATKEEIEEAITTVLQGKLFFNISSIATPNEKDTPLLTRREKEILLLIADVHRISGN